jgi:hypothetical protein
MIVSHSVFKEQKKHQRDYLFQQAFLLERRITYANCFSRSTAFFVLFFRTIYHSILTRFAACFVSNKAGHHTHLSLFGNPFFKLFSEQFIIRFSLASQRVLFRTRRVIVRIKKNHATFFDEKIHSRPETIKNTNKTAPNSCFKNSLKTLNSVIPSASTIRIDNYNASLASQY